MIEGRHLAGSVLSLGPHTTSVGLVCPRMGTMAGLHCIPHTGPWPPSLSVGGGFALPALSSEACATSLWAQPRMGQATDGLPGCGVNTCCGYSSGSLRKLRAQLALSLTPHTLTERTLWQPVGGGGPVGPELSPSRSVTPAVGIGKSLLWPLTTVSSSVK